MKKTYFGLEITEWNEIECVNLADISKLPFNDYWVEKSVGATIVKSKSNGEPLVYLHDWEKFCENFIENGINR